MSSFQDGDSVRLIQDWSTVRHNIVPAGTVGILSSSNVGLGGVYKFTSLIGGIEFNIVDYAIEKHSLYEYDDKQVI